MKKVLIISKFIPAPTFSGGAVRNSAWIKFLSRHYELTLIGYWDKQYGEKKRNEIDCFCKHVYGFTFYRDLLSICKSLTLSILNNRPLVINQYYKNDMMNKIVELLKSETFDFIFCQELSSMQFIPKEISVPVLFDDHNIEFELQRRIGEESNIAIKRMLYKIESFRVKKFELNSWERATIVFFVSARDRDNASKHFHLSKSIIVNNTYPDTDESPLLPSQWFDTPTCAFIGNLSWKPNRMGLKHFMEVIYPEIKKTHPNLKIIIMGSNTPKSLKKYFNNDNVTLYENIDEKEKKYILSKIWLCLVPLYSGSGTRIKILEYWSHSKPVVSTPIGAEGLINSCGTVIAENDSEFIHEVERLLKNKELLNKMGQLNYLSFKKHYEEGVVYENSLYSTIASKLNESNTQL